MLGAVEAVLGEEGVEVVRRARRLGGGGEEAVEERGERGGEGGRGACGLRELGDVGAFTGREVAGFAAEQGRDRELIEFDGQECIGAAEERGDGAVFVDSEVVNDGVHRERQRGLQLALGGEHDLEQA